MPRGLLNWTFDDVVAFLKQHRFVLSHIEGSHHYFVGNIDGKQRLTFIQNHGKKSIPPLSLKGTIHKSGIPVSIWKKWAKAGSSKARRNVMHGA